MLSITMDRWFLIYCCCVTALLGAVFGSFLNCAAWRIAHGEKVTKGRSHCPNCGHVLGPIDLIPILGWLIRGGKCAYCKEKISVRYPLTELFFALQAVLCLLQFDLTLVCLRNLIFLGCLFVLSLVDLEIMEIPDGTLITAGVAWILYAFVGQVGVAEMAKSVTSGLAYGAMLLVISLLFDKIFNKESMGGGDIKLFAVVGLYLGWILTLFAVFFSCLIGLLFAVVIRRRSTAEDSAPFPFGPAIALAAWMMLLYGEPLAQWYLGLLM